jgi:hypothetical protein
MNLARLNALADRVIAHAERRLTNLDIREVSAVKRAANPHSRVLLMKRDEPNDVGGDKCAKNGAKCADDVGVRKPDTEKEVAMNTDVAKAAVTAAANVWNGLVELTAKQANISVSKAVDQCLQTELGQQAFALAKRCDGASFLKIGGGDLPQPPQGHPHHGGDNHYSAPMAPRSAIPGSTDYAMPRQRSGKAASSLPDPKDYGASRGRFADGDDDDVAAEAFKRFSAAVDQCVGDGMSRSKAMDHCVAKFPNLWGAAKRYKFKSALRPGT